MVIEYEKLSTGIVDYNLTLAEEPTPEPRGGDSLGGFLAECYLGQRAAPHINASFHQWHTHYREHNI